MWDSVISILTWAFPGGLSVINIFLVRELWKRNKSKISKDTIDTWRQIAESNNAALLHNNQIIVENNETILSLRISLAQLDSNTQKLEQMLQLIVDCNNYAECPVRPELQHYEAAKRKRNTRQSVRNRKDSNAACDNSTVANDSAIINPPIESPSTGCDIYGGIGTEQDGGKI